jgi:short-subunit dehydrogenase
MRQLIEVVTGATKDIGPEIAYLLTVTLMRINHESSRITSA